MAIDFGNPLIQKALKSLITILVLYSAAYVAIRLINVRISDLKRRYRARKIAYYTATALVVIVLALIWIEQTRALATALGIIGAGVALALSQPLLSIAGWLLLMVRRPFDVGDRIELGKVHGDVIDIRLFQTMLMEIGNWVEADQSTGRIVHCPNSLIFTEPIYNYTRGFEFIWNEIKALVTFESDWKRAEEIILQCAREEGEQEQIQAKLTKDLYRLSQRHLIFPYTTLTPYVYISIQDSGVELTLRYLTEARKRRTTEDRISRRILEAFAKEPNVGLAYPTYRIYRRDIED